MATNTQKRVCISDSEANPKPSCMVPKKGKMNKKLSKQEKEEIVHSLLMWLNNREISMMKSMRSNTCKSWCEAIALYGLIFTRV